jgi:hypothetical protein
MKPKQWGSPLVQKNKYQGGGNRKKDDDDGAEAFLKADISYACLGVSAFYVTQSSITMFTRACHWTLF